MGRQKSYQRDHVLLHAMNAFWDKGYHATTLADLCAATELNRNTLYTEFGSKSALFHDALQLYTDYGVQQACFYLKRKPGGLDNIRDYFRSMSYAPECRGCLMTMTINQRNLVSARSMRIVHDALSTIEQLLLENITAEFKGKHGRSQEDCRRLATFLIFSIQGITTMGKFEGDQSKLDDVVTTILSVLDHSSPCVPSG